MTIEEKFIVSKLATIPRKIGFDTVFINDMNKWAGGDLTPRQTEFIYRLLYKYKHLLPHTYNAYKDHKFCRGKKNYNKKAAAPKNWEKLYKN